MKVRWSPEALQDRRDIFDHIGPDNPRAAARMDQLFVDAGARLLRFPEMARPGQLPGTRELIPHPNYRIVYAIRDDSIYILAVFHVSRQWPPGPEGDA